MSWLGRLLGRRRLEGDLEREVSFHLDQHARDLMASGLPAEEARRRARIEFGGVEQVKEETRDARGTRWVEDWWTDTRYALRAMGKSKAFTAAAVLTLAIGIGANTAVFGVIRALLLRSLPVERPEALFLVQMDGPDGADQRISGPAFEKYRAAVGDRAQLAAMSTVIRMYATIGDTPESIQGQLVSGDWFRLLGVTTSVGRPIATADAVDGGGEPVAVLSHDYWVRRFGQSPAVVGQSIRINGAPVTIVGVAAAPFFGMIVGARTDVFLPLSMQPAVRYMANANMDNADPFKPWYPQLGIRWLTVVGRTGPGETMASLQSRLEAPLRADLETRFPDSATRAFQSRTRLALPSAAKGISPLREQFSDPLKVLMVTVGLVLLVACANLASLLLARSAGRQHEVAVRMSLGARGGRLIRQVLTESVTLAMIGGVASLAVGFWGSRALLIMASSTPGAVPLTVSFDWRMIGFVAGISLATGVGFGLAPALRMPRTDLYDAFKTGGRVTGDRRGREWPVGRMLVVAQVGLSLALVVVASVFVRSAQKLTAVNPGYDRDTVLSARIDVRAAGYPTEQLPGLYQRLIDQATAVPGVRSASVSVYGLGTSSFRSSSISVPGKIHGPEWDPTIQVNTVSDGFLATTGISLLKGRAFGPADGPGAPRVAIVNRALAKRFFETDNPVGHRFGWDDSDPIFEVIGLIDDIRPNGLREDPGPLALLPIAQDADTYVYSLEARVTGSPTAAGPALRQAIAAVDRALPVREIVTLGELLDRGLQQERMVSRLTGIFGLLAALLAAIGLYGVMSYSVARRTNEMGVRLALGASPTGVRRLILRDTISLVLGGLLLGGVLLVPALTGIESLVYGMSPRDPVAIGFAVMVLLAAGLVAGGLPAWRAARVDPVTALRKD